MSNYCTCHLKEKCKWCRLKAENKRYREAIERAIKMIKVATGTTESPKKINLHEALEIYEELLQALSEISRGEASESRT